MQQYTIQTCAEDQRIRLLMIFASRPVATHHSETPSPDTPTLTSVAINPEAVNLRPTKNAHENFPFMGGNDSRASSPNEDLQSIP